MEKAKIYDFCVGELFITEEKEAKRLLKRGAIDMKQRRVQDVRNTQTNEKFYPVFTIFINTKDGFICLHNGKFYARDDFTQDTAFNIKPFVDNFPCTCFRWPPELSAPEALTLFNRFFKKGFFNRADTLYVKDKWIHLSKLFVGDLRLYEGFYSMDSSSPYTFETLPDMLMLEKSDAKFIERTSDRLEKESGRFIGVNRFVTYETLFIKLRDNKMYSLHNNRIYSGEKDLPSHHKTLYPLEALLAREGIACEENISASMALSRYRKVK